MAKGTTAATAATAPSVPEGESVPTYPTQLAPPVTLRYEMQRGLPRGSGELAWRPDGERYALTLGARLAGTALLTQVSPRSVDNAGIAPQRFTDQRGRRAPQAANLDRKSVV
jgi:hypothetical protein